jgi:hypothetical protein
MKNTFLFIIFINFKKIFFLKYLISQINFHKFNNFIVVDLKALY